jgi:gas vesicle protein
MESSAEPEVYPQEKAQPAWETSGPAETPVRPQFDLEPEKAATGLKAELPESSAAASGPVEPVKKKRGRKKAVETGEPKPKAVRKKAKVAKNRDASTIVVPDDYMQVSAPQAYPAAPLEGTAPDFSLESLGVKSDLSAESENLSWESLGSKPVIEEMAAPVPDEMSFAAGADETAAAVSPGYGETAEQSSTISAWDTDSAVLDSEVQATPSSISELGTFPDLQTPAVEEPAPFQPRQNFEPVSTSEWSAPVAETVSTPPAYAAAVEQVPETEPAPAGGYDRGSARTQSELGYRPAFASAEPAAQSAGHQAGEEYGQEIMVKTVWGMPLTIGLVLGLIFGGAAAWMIANSQASGEEARSKESFAKQLMAAKTETDKIQTEANKMRDTLKAQAAAWRKTPDKPAHIKVGQGVLFYWSNEGMMRKYFVYRGKGPAGNMLKINPEPLDMNFLYLNRVEAGTWRFAVSAQTPEGVETDKGEPVVLSFPLAR